MSILLERYDQLDLPLYRRVAFEREAVAVAPDLLSEVSESRAALLDYLASGARAYGVNTGLGYLASRGVEDVDQAAFQRSVLPARSAGLGRRLSEPVVRGAILLRLTGFLSGYAGVTPELCSFLADRLNDGWFPVVPGSVSGAAGEIVPLAHLFSTLVGDGFVWADGLQVSAETRLATLGVARYELGAKEGIALNHGAPLAPAVRVPLLLRADALLEHATLCGAAAVALSGAAERPYVLRVGERKGDPGQLAVHRRLVALLAPSGDQLSDARQARGSLRVRRNVHRADG